MAWYSRFCLYAIVILCRIWLLILVLLFVCISLVSHKENIDTDTPSGKFMLTVFAHSLNLKENSLNSDSVRASRSPKHRASTQAESPLKSTGRGSGSSMGNGSRRTSRAGTLCGEWACPLTPFTAVSGSMKRNTESPSRPLLNHYF